MSWQTNNRTEKRYTGDQHQSMRLVRMRTPFNTGRVEAYGKESDRITGVENVPELDAGFRPINRAAAVSGVRKTRLEVKDAEENPMYDKEKHTIRADVLLLAVMVLVVTLAAGWLLDRSRLNGYSKDLSEIGQGIRMTSDELIVMEEKYNQAVADVDMVRYAVEKLGMISTGGANRVMLEVPADVVEGPVAPTDGVVTQFATIQGNR